MSTPNSQHQGFGALRRLRFAAVTGVSLAASLGMVAPAYAAIDNIATARGTAPGGAVDGVTDPSNPVAVPVAPAAPSLTVSKTAGSFVDVNSDGIIKGGDTIQFTITVTNNGNITMFNVVPLETGTGNGATFNGVAGTGTFGAFTPASATIAPGGNQVYTVTYTLSNADAFRAAGLANQVVNTAKATGNVGTSGGPVISQTNVTAGTVSTTLPANPELTLTKSYVLVKAPGNTVAGQAEVGDTINYTYTAFNSGNTTLTNVKVDDVHEGTTLPNTPTRTVNNETLLTDGPLANSSDVPATPKNGIWTTMGAGATVTFTYAHTVTQGEFNNQ